MSEGLAQVAGIDISKHHLDVDLDPGGATRRVSNRSGLRRSVRGRAGRERRSRRDLAPAPRIGPFAHRATRARP